VRCKKEITVCVKDGKKGAKKKKSSMENYL
jgi:hypothetical protein